MPNDDPPVVPTRRAFLQTLAVPLLAPLAACAPRGGSTTDSLAGAVAPADSGGPPPSGPRLGLSLYTARHALQRDPDGTLAAIARIGYRDVETHSFYGRPVAEMRRLLDRHGLRTPSGHVNGGVAAMRASSERAFDEAETLGQRFVVLPWLPESERTADAYRRLAERCNPWGEAARARGLTLVYHHHEFEFDPLPGGRTGWDIVVDSTDPTLMKLQVDAFWMNKVGRDPVDYVARNRDRVVLLHAKDATRAPERKMVDVGAGTIDFRGLVREARQAGVIAIYVEHDEPADALGTARAGFEHLRRLMS
jgi:sugar phosphate isomerase/epimerase